MEGAITIDGGASKSDIRQKVWDYMETKDLANFPRPVHHRIPNFKVPDQMENESGYKPSLYMVFGAQGACSKITSLEFFSKSTEVKVDPDKPLEGARLAALQARKTLLVPTPRLRTGLFNKIVPPQSATKEDLRICSTSQGVKEFSVPIGLDARAQVDLVVVGSVAVSEKGYRIGKGEGYADMEYAMMDSMGAVKESTVVVTVVHDCQVVDLPEELIENHDLTVDYILTPTRSIKTECKRPKPQGIIWSKLDAEMLERIPILKKLRALEQKAGKDVSLKGSPRESERPKKEPEPNPSRVPKRDHRHPKKEAKPQLTASVDGGGEEDDPVSTLYLGSIPAGLRVSELKGLLRERNAMPFKLTWQGAHRRAFLEYRSVEAADLALDALYGLSINGHTVEAQRARRQRGSNVSSASKGSGRTKKKEQLTERTKAATSAFTIKSQTSREGTVQKDPEELTTV